MVIRELCIGHVTYSLILGPNYHLFIVIVKTPMAASETLTDDNVKKDKR